MAQYVAAALAGVEADSKDDAWECAQHNVLEWEVTGVTDVEDIHVVLAPAEQMIDDPRGASMITRPWFGKASLILGPALAWVTLGVGTAPERWAQVLADSLT